MTDDCAYNIIMLYYQCTKTALFYRKIPIGEQQLIILLNAQRRLPINIIFDKRNNFEFRLHFINSPRLFGYNMIIIVRLCRLKVVKIKCDSYIIPVSVGRSSWSSLSIKYNYLYYKYNDLKLKYTNYKLKISTRVYTIYYRYYENLTWIEKKRGLKLT